jgi:hypothetical protein
VAFPLPAVGSFIELFFIVLVLRILYYCGSHSFGRTEFKSQTGGVVAERRAAGNGSNLASNRQEGLSKRRMNCSFQPGKPRHDSFVKHLDLEIALLVTSAEFGIPPPRRNADRIEVIQFFKRQIVLEEDCTQ